MAACVPLQTLQPHTPHALQLSLPAQWSSTPVEATNTAVQGQWWRQFADVMLDELIEQALHSAHDLRTAQVRLQQARAALDLAEAGLWPSIGTSVGATRARSGHASPQTQYSAGFDASWEPSIFGGLRDGVSAAEFDLAASQATLGNAQVSLAAEVALNYVSLRSLQQRLQIARSNLAAQEDTWQLVSWRQQAGLASELELTQATANLASTRAGIPGLEASIAAAMHRLALLTGQMPSSLQPRLSPVRALPTTQAIVGIPIPADTLNQRPDVRAAQLALSAELARLDQRRAETWPSLRLSGSLGWRAASTSALGSGANVAASLAASLATTLFDGGRIRARIAAQDASAEQALISYEKTILTALEDVENALAEQAAAQTRLQARRQAATAATRAAELARQMYRSGMVDFQRTLDAERTRLSAEDGAATAQAEELNALIRLYKALGGGWQMDSADVFTSSNPAEAGEAQQAL
ncbi:MAG: efflux transporter outer membrane subunit [Sterolibacterium sp.]|nr:efflux transporter outer membrane subunit [Sterolibacterium sp.]